MQSHRMRIMAAGLAIALAGPARAQERNPGGKSDGGGNIFRPEIIGAMATELGLSESVLKKIKDKVYESDREQINLHAGVKAARLDLRRLMDADEPNVAKVMGLVEAVGKAETKVKQNRVRLMLSIRGLLTKEQRTRLQTLVQERRRERHREARRPPRPPRPPTPPLAPQPPRAP